MPTNVKIPLQESLEPVYLLLVAIRSTEHRAVIDFVQRLLVAVAAAAIWSTIPLTIRLLTTMKRRSGLYFCAILITTLGISVRQVGVLTLWLTPTAPWVIRRLLVEAGTIAMVSGFSVVLVSGPHSLDVIM
jgi:hypothetical protein